MATSASRHDLVFTHVLVQLSILHTCFRASYSIPIDCTTMMELSQPHLPMLAPSLLITSLILFFMPLT